MAHHVYSQAAIEHDKHNSRDSNEICSIIKTSRCSSLTAHQGGGRRSLPTASVLLPGVEVGGVNEKDDDKAGNDGTQDYHKDREERRLAVEVRQTVAG